jgi:hypothetical protein
LPNDFMSGGKRNEVREAFQGDHVPVAHVLRNGVP